MTKRSTRNKLKHQVKMCIDDLDDLEQHLVFLDGLADAQHPLILQHLPTFVTLLELFRGGLRAFRASL